MALKAQQGRKQWLEEVDSDSDDEASIGGNMGWVMSGDPSQLPPVNDKELISKQKPETKLERSGKQN